MSRLREEHHSSVKEFNAQIEKKNYDLEKVQREKGDLLNTLHEKTLSLQDLTKNSQDTYIKCKDFCQTSKINALSESNYRFQR